MKIERIETTPIKHPTVKDFYKHPYLNVWLSKDKDCVLTKDGFVEPSVGGEYKYYLKKHIHLLKAETFLEKPTTSIKLIANHINGKKFDNRLSNIEWNTYSMNIRHAFVNGLRSDNYRGFLKDLETEEVLQFTSLTECADFLGLHKPVLTRYLNSERLYPLKYKFVLTLVGEAPSNLTKNDIGKFKKGTAFPFIVENEKEEIKRFFFFKEGCAKFLGISTEKLYKCFKDGSYENWVFKEIGSYENYVKALTEDEYTKSVIEGRGKKSGLKNDDLINKPVSVTNHLTNVTKDFKDIVEFAKENKYDLGSISRSLKSKSSWGSYTFNFNE